MFTKALLEVVLFFEVFLAHGYAPYYSQYNDFLSSASGSSFLGGDTLNNVFHGKDISLVLSPSFLEHLSKLVLLPPTEDPATLTCGQQPLGCAQTRYRTYDGSCNNLGNPILGTPQTPYSRLLPPIYGDGISSPTRARSGRDLPPARSLSLALFPDIPSENPKFTLAAMQFGQVITHDMSLAAGSQPIPGQTQCCSDGQIQRGAGMLRHCYPLVLQQNDIQNREANVKCLNFLKSNTDRDRNCVGGFQPAEQITVVNAFLDLSLLYGNTDMSNQQVRQFQGGLLRVSQRNGKQWLSQDPNVTVACPDAQDVDEPCYLAGDSRVNQNTHQTLFYIILLREHNRLATILGQLNPQWNDERIFQEARRINIAQHQHITYYEWLPIFLGIENSLKNRIVFDTKGFVNDYNAGVDPGVINEHATVAFRFFHSLIVGRLDLVTENRDSFGSIRMADWFIRPAVLEQGNNFDDLIRGLTTQPTRKSTQFADSGITQFLYRMGNRTFGQDLRVLDIQRSRDHGLASYNDFRAFCGLTRANSFEDFLDVISRENVKKLTQFYETPDDVDLTVGGALERIVPGTLAGPVFLCILTKQFYRTRVGDRFFYENGGDSGFTLAQLNQIRKTSMSRLFCDNGNNIRSMQPRGFERINKDNNVVPCENLPAVDLRLWQENGGSGSDSGLALGQSQYNFAGSEYFLELEEEEEIKSPWLSTVYNCD